jgi:CheY-like chemotaxis protein
VRLRLLIVEDSELDRELMVQIFEGLYEVETAVDGENALAAAATLPDLILLDIGLPALSGLDAARAIRATMTMPIIAVSSQVMPGDRERALEAGCDEFVPKPFDDTALVALVGRFLGRR